ncbi:MAG: polysaccharide deacetylase family protein [Candidatus Omnitrophica bacterium]|nr:polysaccharide deacetylase family protein [Candidatus Omnitrophota bacterium]
MPFKPILYRLLFLLQAHHLFRYFFRQRLIILTYHGFTDSVDHRESWNYDGKHVWIRNFEEQIRYLAKHYRPVSLPQWLSSIQIEGRELPYSVIVTFDDGYASNYRLAYPILKKYGVPATVFVATEFAGEGNFLWTDRLEYAVLNCAPQIYSVPPDGSAPIEADCRTPEAALASLTSLKTRLKRLEPSEREKIMRAVESALGCRLTAQNAAPEYRPLEWRQMKAMTAGGLVSIGSHTHSHVILSHCGGEEVRRELIQSRELIEKHTGSKCDLFCYPNGQAGDFNTATREALIEMGFACGLTTVEGMNHRLTDIYSLKRVGVGNQTDGIEFVMTLSGIKWLFSGLKARLKRVIRANG